MGQYFQSGWIFWIWLLKARCQSLYWEENLCVAFGLYILLLQLKTIEEMQNWTNFYKKFHIRIWELFFPHNVVVKNMHALHLFISLSNPPIQCKRPATLGHHKGAEWNTHEENTLQLVGNSLSVPAFASCPLPCVSPLAWERWYLRARGCDGEELGVTLSISVGTESIKGFQLSSGIRAAQVSDI